MGHVVVVAGVTYDVSHLPALAAVLGLFVAIASLFSTSRRREGERYAPLLVAVWAFGSLWLLAAPIAFALVLPRVGESHFGPDVLDVVDLPLLGGVIAATASQVVSFLGFLVGAVRAPAPGSRASGFTLTFVTSFALLPLAAQMTTLLSARHLPSVTAELPAARLGAPGARLRAAALGEHTPALYVPSVVSIDTSVAGTHDTEVALEGLFVRITRPVTVAVDEESGDVELAVGARFTWACRRTGTHIVGVPVDGAGPTLEVRVERVREVNGLSLYTLSSTDGGADVWNVAGRSMARTARGEIGPLVTSSHFAALALHPCSGTSPRGVPTHCSGDSEGSWLPGIFTLGIVVEADGELDCQLVE